MNYVTLLLDASAYLGLAVGAVVFVIASIVMVFRIRKTAPAVLNTSSTM